MWLIIRLPKWFALEYSMCLSLGIWSMMMYRYAYCLPVEINLSKFLMVNIKNLDIFNLSPELQPLTVDF